jgi:hypothetical protein
VCARSAGVRKRACVHAWVRAREGARKRACVKLSVNSACSGISRPGDGLLTHRQYKEEGRTGDGSGQEQPEIPTNCNGCCRWWSKSQCCIRKIDMYSNTCEPLDHAPTHHIQYLAASRDRHLAIGFRCLGNRVCYAWLGLVGYSFVQD